MSEGSISTEISQGENKLGIQEKFYNFLRRKDAAEQRSQVESLSKDLLDRLDMEKLVDDPNLVIYAEQYRELLSVESGVTQGLHKKQGYIENTAIRYSLENIKKGWQEKGLLKEKSGVTSESDGEKSVLSQEQLAEKRKFVGATIKSAYDQRGFLYVNLKTDNYQGDLSVSVYGFTKALDIENSDKSWFYPSHFGYSQVEFDDRFLNTIMRHSQNLFDGQRQAVKEYVAKNHEGESILGKPWGEEETNFMTDRLAPDVRIMKTP